LGESESIHCASIANAYQGSKVLSILYTNMRERRQLKLAGFAESSTAVLEIYISCMFPRLISN